MGPSYKRGGRQRFIDPMRGETGMKSLGSSGCRWSLTILFLIVTISWFATKYWCICWVLPYKHVAIWLEEGGIVVGEHLREEISRTAGVFAETASGDFEWWLDYSKVGSFRSIFVPMWLVLAPIAACGFMAWWKHGVQRVRMARGWCVNCGYDRANIESNSRCPECGIMDNSVK